MHSDEVHELVDEYCRRHALAPFNLSALVESREIWQDKTLADGPGCYAIYDAARALRYIGASYSIKRRSYSHFATKVQECSFWRDRPAVYVQLIWTREFWEPWSLEIFLTLRTDTLRKKHLLARGKVGEPS